MGLIKNVIILAVVGFSIQLIYKNICTHAPLPNIPAKNYWGPGNPKNDDETIKPFKIKISDAVLQDLKTRLELEQRLQPSLEGTNFDYGFRSEELKKIMEFWRTKYNWRERETMLNSLPQFTTQISGLNIHFMHIKPKNVPKDIQVLPLMVVNGFPGSFREFYEIIPMLTSVEKGRDFVFEVVVPSLPGYVFSESSHKPGMSPAHMSAILRQLMLRLGHTKFYIHGEDWGSIVAENLGMLFPDNVLGLHNTLCAVNTPLTYAYLGMASVWPSSFMRSHVAEALYPLGDYISKLVLESGYLHIQATKPDTLGAALSNSPAGLAAYILEKFSAWTDMKNRDLPDGGLTRKFKLEDLLDSVMLYWVSGSVTSTLRIYAEFFAVDNQKLEWDRVPVHVPTFCVQFPNELIQMPEWVMRRKYKQLLPVSDPAPGTPLHAAMLPQKGGHFVAFEEPQITADSIVQAVILFRDTAAAKQVKT